MAAQNNILSQLGVKSKGTVYMSVTPGTGLEVIQLDNTTRTVAAYGFKPLDYNESLRELADYNQFKEAALELFQEMNINPKSNVILNLPMVSFGITERPLILGDDFVTGSLVSEVESSYVFKRHEPAISWTDANTGVSNDMRKILYTAMQQTVIDNISAALAEIGATLLGVEISLTSLLKALDYSGATEAQMKDGITWNLMLISSNGYSIISMVGKNIVDYYEEPLALKTFEGEEIYNAICSSAHITLMSYPANYLYIVSESNIVSAELIAKKINSEGIIDYLENNHFKKHELLTASLNIVPDNVLKISAQAVGIAVPRILNYPVKFDFISKQSTESSDDNEPVKLRIGENEFEIAPTTATKIAVIVAAILIVPIILLLLLMPKVAESSKAKLATINKEISEVDVLIKTLSDNKKVSSFDEKETIKTTLDNNKTKLMSYIAIGDSVPKDLWLTYYKTQNNGQIDIKGQADSVEDVYLFFKNMKDSLLNTNLRLHKLEMISENVDDIVDAAIVTPGYDFEITNMTEEELSAELSGGDEDKAENEPPAKGKKTTTTKKKTVEKSKPVSSAKKESKPVPKSQPKKGNYAKEVTGK